MLSFESKEELTSKTLFQAGFDFFRAFSFLDYRMCVYLGSIGDICIACLLLALIALIFALII